MAENKEVCFGPWVQKDSSSLPDVAFLGPRDPLSCPARLLVVVVANVGLVARKVPWASAVLIHVEAVVATEFSIHRHLQHKAMRTVR